MTSQMLCDLAVDGVRGLSPYQPGKPIEELQRELGIDSIVKLASNENPFGAGKLARAAMDAELDDIGRYPDGSGFVLKAALAEHHDLDPACITLGNGSNDVLDLIARAWLGPGRAAVFSEHAFAVYPIVTHAVGAEARIAPAVDWGHDLNAMRALINDQTRVVFVANPNNPTGTWLNSSALHDFIASVPNDVLVVLDEAYFEYVDEADYPDGRQWLDEFPNLVVTRTFSKAHGLAALRVGYSLSSPEVADMLNRVRQPFNCNSLALAAAAATLKDHEHLAKSVQTNRDGMQLLTAGLQRLGLDFIPSVGNFLAVDMGRDAAPLNQALLREGVIVRPVGNYGMPQHLRISIGLPEENARALEALAAVI